MSAKIDRINQMNCNCLIIPGYGGSGDAHWQTIWENEKPALFTRVNQADWLNPNCQTWMEKLESSIAAREDPASDIFPQSIIGFNKVPTQKFSFPSHLIASDNDPYSKMEFSRACAVQWGSTFHVVNNGGHLNSESDEHWAGKWPSYG